MSEIKLAEAREITEEGKQVYITPDGKRVVIVDFEEYETLIHDAPYKGFYDQIDWVRLGRLLESEKGYDGTGWEYLGRAWRTNSPEGVVAYLFRAFNKREAYTALLENLDAFPEEERIILKRLTDAAYYAGEQAKDGEVATPITLQGRD